eukprot:TRINITY_DN5867_c0_g1_i1.p1 TRINITY_DN5867_c0_g1~~TRINITY_DN5867_c0_g1_i1.p1  ORF type:complete len:367 (+),score=128.71 TRINITY_DN5867_c0_g1_i1:78-1178(+)
MMSRLSSSGGAQGGAASGSGAEVPPSPQIEKAPRFALAEDPEHEEVGDDEIFEFLEGLIEGFRAAAQAAAEDSLKVLDEPKKEPPREAQEQKEEKKKTNVKDLIKRGGAGGLGAWAELDALGKAKQREMGLEATQLPPDDAQAQQIPPADAMRRSGGGGYPGAGGGGAPFPDGRAAEAPQQQQQQQQGSLRGGAPGAQRQEEPLLQRQDERQQRSGGMSGGNAALSAASAFRGAPSSPPAAAPGPLDSVSSLMRLHALRSFFEETCGTVANAFDLMASTALRARGGTGGTAEERLSYLFHEDEFRNILAGMGYGVDATPAWWRALFQNIDADKDGRISLQDMYDTMVLDLPIIDADDSTNVFFAGR